jgi:hypothetical protein
MKEPKMFARLPKARRLGGARSRRGRAESGQALVIMVGVVLLVVALLAVIVDGGNVVTQQRMTQTGSDATSEAGAIVLANRIACNNSSDPAACTPVGGWDSEVAAKVAQSAAANDVKVDAAYYTDICGIPLRGDGTAALNADGTEDLASALQVGNASGTLPGGVATTPDCPSLTVGPVAGVLVLGTKQVGAFVARAIGISSFTVRTLATAVAGYLQGYCDASEGQWCAVLPVTIPVSTITCDGSNNVVPGAGEWTWNKVLTVPLCKGAPGDVGWLDWTPPGGGTSELIQSILHPDNPAIILPSWQYVTSTGNVNSSGVESAIRSYDGTAVLIPQFDLTCRTKNGDPNPDSTEPGVDKAPNYGCPNAPGGGNGQNIWYRMPSFAEFLLCDPSNPDCGGRYGAYISGNNKAVCDTGNGATSCLVGEFVDVLNTGTVGPGAGGGTGNKALGVQLIK